MTMHERHGARTLTYNRWRGQLSLPFDDMNLRIPDDKWDAELSDLTYSAAHRPTRNGGHLTPRDTMIDIDYLEYCSWCRAPLLLCETARDLGASSDSKSTWVLEALGVRASVPVSLILYTPSGDDRLISHFRISHRQPTATPLIEHDPDEWVQWLTGMRSRHECPKQRSN